MVEINIVLIKIELLFCSFPPACLVGIYSVQENPIDAIPDLSENQVIVFGWVEARR
jgi:Cu/Ag efflux pump CusA